MPMIGLAIAAAAGVAKAEFVDKPKADRQRNLAADTQKWAPWTHLTAEPVQEADPFGSALQFGATGAQIGYGTNQDKRNADLSKSLKGYLDKQGNMAGDNNPWAIAGGPGDTMSSKPQPLSPDISAKEATPMLAGNKKPSGWAGEYPTMPDPNGTDEYKRLYDKNINPDAPYSKWWGSLRS